MNKTPLILSSNKKKILRNKIKNKTLKIKSLKKKNTLKKLIPSSNPGNLISSILKNLMVDSPYSIKNGFIYQNNNFLKALRNIHKKEHKKLIKWTETILQPPSLLLTII